jgi:alkaline phosphatase
MFFLHATRESRCLTRLTTAALVLLIGASVEAKGRKKVRKRRSTKNVIILISDGCGYHQIDAASIYQYGKTGTQVYEEFPVRLGMSTYMVHGDYDPLQAWIDPWYVCDGATDSAAAATTMSTGIKTYGGAIGVDVDGTPLKHFMQAAEELGKSTGVVTSVQFSHATPAGFVAHNVSRNNYAEIANEMIYDSATDVIMGCGAPDYDNDGQPAGNSTKYVGGDATWDDITDDFRVDTQFGSWDVIRSREQFQAMATGDTPARVLGVPYVYQTLQYSRSASNLKSAPPYTDPLISTVPTLQEMANAALNVLDNNPNGFCLMVEAGAVDWAGHGNSSGRVIEEEIDFNLAVEAAVGWVQKNSNWVETVVIVTGDHETGYLTAPFDVETEDPDASVQLVNNGALAMPGMQWNSGSHTNVLIPFYAKGRAAQLFNWAVAGDDPVRGRYIDNSAIGILTFQILGVK